MNIPIEAYIIGASIIGASIGYLAAAILAGARRTRIERDTWNQARLFYERRDNTAPRL